MAAAKTVSGDVRIKTDDGTFIAASQRPNGTWRKPRKVKNGYIPQEEQPKYVCRMRAIFASQGNAVVGMPPRVMQGSVAVRGMTPRSIQAAVAVSGVTPRAVQAPVAVRGMTPRSMQADVAVSGVTPRAVQAPVAVRGMTPRSMQAAVAVSGVTPRAVQAPVAVNGPKSHLAGSIRPAVPIPPSKQLEKNVRHIQMKRDEINLLEDKRKDNYSWPKPNQTTRIRRRTETENSINRLTWDLKRL